MKTALKSILVILIEIVAIVALIFGCVQLFPGKDEVTVTEEDLKDGEEGNVGGNAGAALETEVELEEEPSVETEGEAEEAVAE